MHELGGSSNAEGKQIGNAMSFYVVYVVRTFMRCGWCALNGEIDGIRALRVSLPLRHCGRSTAECRACRQRGTAECRVRPVRANNLLRKRLNERNESVRRSYRRRAKWSNARIIEWYLPRFPFFKGYEYGSHHSQCLCHLLGIRFPQYRRQRPFYCS